VPVFAPDTCGLIQDPVVEAVIKPNRLPACFIATAARPLPMACVHMYHPVLCRVTAPVYWIQKSLLALQQAPSLHAGVNTRQSGRELGGPRHVLQLNFRQSKNCLEARQGARSRGCSRARCSRGSRCGCSCGIVVHTVGTGRRLCAERQLQGPKTFEPSSDPSPFLWVCGARPRSLPVKQGLDGGRAPAPAAPVSRASCPSDEMDRGAAPAAAFEGARRTRAPHFRA
jgi:hypothetical protein